MSTTFAVILCNGFLEKIVIPSPIYLRSLLLADRVSAPYPLLYMLSSGCNPRLPFPSAFPLPSGQPYFFMDALSVLSCIHRQSVYSCALLPAWPPCSGPFLGLAGSPRHKNQQKNGLFSRPFLTFPSSLIPEESPLPPQQQLRHLFLYGHTIFLHPAFYRRNIAMRKNDCQPNIAFQVYNPANFFLSSSGRRPAIWPTAKKSPDSAGSKTYP